MEKNKTKKVRKEHIEGNNTKHKKISKEQKVVENHKNETEIVKRENKTAKNHIEKQTEHKEIKEEHREINKHEDNNNKVVQEHQKTNKISKRIGQKEVIDIKNVENSEELKEETVALAKIPEIEASSADQITKQELIKQYNAKKADKTGFNGLVAFLLISIIATLIVLGVSMYRNHQKKYEFLNYDIENNVNDQVDYVLLDGDDEVQCERI